MAELSGLQVFKYLPAAKKLPEGNCKKCGFPTCMAFGLKLAKGQAEIELCPYAPEELKEIFTQSMKKPQKEVYLGHKNKVLVGGENVLFRHDKTFINKTAIAVVLDVSKGNWEEKLKRITDFEITRVSETFRIDLIYLKGDLPLSPALSHEGRGSNITQKLDDLGFAWIVEDDLSELTQIEDGDVFDVMKTLTEFRKKAVLEKDENYSNPVYVYFKHDSRHPELVSGSHNRTPEYNIRDEVNANEILNSKDCCKTPSLMLQDDVSGEYFNNSDLLKLMSKASFYLCKYANLLVFEDFNEALISTLMTLRQNIYTDPQKPLQVESKIYEFNNPDENALVFLTTNFALTYFAVASELESLNQSSYLVVTPSDGMSVLTAWSAEKFTAQIAAKTVNKYELAKKIKNKQIIIPGLLSHMKGELEEALPDFKIVVGTNEAYLISDFVKDLK